MTDRGERDFWRKYWDHKKGEVRAIRESGEVRIYTQNRRFVVIAPYNKDFKIWAIENGGRWRTKSEFWTFPMSLAGALDTTVKEMYGDCIVRYGKTSNPNIYR